jgi:hypothetical protein
MNQKVVVYIILSAILLYLYYKRGDLAIFAAFVVVVAGTLIFRSGNASAREGMSIGGGGGGDKECAKLGFTAPKLLKSDIGGSLEKEMNKIKKVADKYWPYDEKGNSNNEDEKKSLLEFMEVYFKEAGKMKDDDGKKNSNDFYEISLGLYNQVNNPDKSKRQKIKMDAINITSELTKPIISGGNILLKLLTTAGKSNKIKDAGAKKLAKYLTCLCKHWIAIYTKMEEVANGGGGGKDDEGGGDDEDKPKKKKKKATKKKKSKKDDADDADAEDAEDE